MNRKIKIVAGVVALVVGAVAVGWIYFQLNPAAWDSFISEMQGAPVASSERRPESRPVRRFGALVASGNIEADEVTVAAEVGGRVLSIVADEGTIVATGDVLLRLNDQALRAQRDGAEAIVEQARAALAAAQAQLARAEAGATPSQIAAAEAAVLAVQGSVAAAVAAVNQAEINADSARTVEEGESSVVRAEAVLAQAQGTLDLAQADLARARAELARLQAGARPEEIAMYQGMVNQAQSEFLYYENLHFSYFIDKDIGGGPEERARYQRESARGALSAAQAQLNLARAGATDQEIAAGTAAVSAALAQVAIAAAGVDLAEAALAEAEAASETTRDQVELADAGVTAAQAQKRIAEGQLGQAEAELARLQEGATEEELAILEAQVAEAQALVASAEAALKTLDIELARTTVTAPVGGIILECLLNEGELATLGAPLFTLTDLDEVTLTVYVPEADLGIISHGQAVEVSVDAYDEVFAGEVSHIASQAEFTPKNVQTQEERVHMVFAVKVRLANPDHLLKPGMPADATFG